MKLFVYGTLRLSHPNSQRFDLTADRLVAQGVKLEGYGLFPVSWFPGVQPTDDLSSVVVGDIFEIPDNLWGALDSYEGVPHLYTRELVQGSGHEDTYIYIYNGTVDPDSRITTGEWKSHG